MHELKLHRRTFLVATAGWMTALPIDAGARTSGTGALPMNAKFPVKAIGSANALAATKLAVERMAAGADTLDAAIAGVSLLEDDPNETSVGLGGLPNEAGVVELDAAVMHGPTHKAGAVGALHNIKNPAQVAQRVLHRSDHVLLVGDGALAFAKAHGFKEQNLLSEKARKIWLYWKETSSQGDDWLPPAEGELDPDVAEFFGLPKRKLRSTNSRGARTTSTLRAKFQRPTGTVYVAAMNATGEMSCATSTSGLAFKIPGRVGDSPIVGAGLYVDNDVGSCGSTGRGEANLENLCCFAAVELMRGGASPTDAGLEVLRRVVKQTDKRLRDEAGRPSFGLQFYLLARDGTHAGVSLWGPTDFAVTDAQGSRCEVGRYLLRRAKSKR